MVNDRPDSNRSVVFVGSDLMARERIRSAAANLEMRARSAAVSELVDALRAEPADVLVFDLDEGRDGALEVVRAVRSEGLAPPVVLGFYSHVDRAIAAAAAGAGCTPVRRGHFWSHLPKWLGDPNQDAD
jgi:DNA-binding NarL/FixJ family response regulator